MKVLSPSEIAEVSGGVGEYNTYQYGNMVDWLASGMAGVFRLITGFINDFVGPPPPPPMDGGGIRG